MSTVSMVLALTSRQMLRTVDAAQVDAVDLKAHLMGVEAGPSDMSASGADRADVHSLIRNARTTIRI